MPSTEQLKDWPTDVQELLSRGLPGQAKEWPAWHFDDGEISLAGLAAYLTPALYLSPGSIVTRVLLARDEHPDYLFEFIGLRPPASGITMIAYPEPRPGLIDAQRQLVVRRARAYFRRSLVVGELAWIPPDIVEDRIVHAVAGVDDRRNRDRPMRAAADGIDLLFDIVKHPGGRKKTPKDAKVDKLARIGLKWLQSHNYTQVTDFGRPEMGEATGRGPAGIHKHMGREPAVVNDDVHQRMRELLAEEESAR